MILQSEKWTCYVLLLSLISCIVSGLQIVVQFDGSLRPPHDFGTPTSTLGRMAACACTISRRTSDFGSPLLLVMGGKGLEATSTSTSGEVEYEGLLFAFKSLRTYLAQQNSTAIESITSITVSGDCKTIIDQMNGKSIPRKLDTYYYKALAEADAVLHETFHHCGPVTNLQFQHVARNNNVICDRISASIIINQQKEAFDEVCSDLLNYEMWDEKAMTLTDILNKWFQHQKSLIPLSRRPSLYRFIAEAVTREKHYSGLLDVGSRYENDVKILERNWLKTKQTSDDTDTRSAPMFSNLKAEAISYQMLSLYALGRKKEAERLKTKNHFLLNRCSSIVLEKVGNIPKNETILSLKRVMADTNRIHSRNRMDWPFHAEQWYDELIHSETTWKERRELLIVRQFL